MIQGAFDPSIQVTRLFELLLTILQPAFWGLLCLGFVLAGAHFLTMLATRWGNRQVSSKALFFSLAVHISMGCGLVALIPEYRGRLLKYLDEEEPQPIEIQAIISESPQTTHQLRSGNTPVWEQLPSTVAEDLTRFDRTMEPVELDEGPAPRPEPVQLDQRRLKDVTVLPEQPVELPEQQLAAIEGATQQAVLPLEVETPEQMAREEQAVPSPERARSDANTPAAVQEPDLDKPKFGAVDRPREDYLPEPDVASIQARAQELAKLQERDETEDIRNRSGPAMIPLEVEEIGRSEEPDAEGEKSLPGRREFTRSPARSPREAADSAPERQRFDILPQTPRPSSDRPLATLDGTSTNPNRPPEFPELERQNFAPLRQSDLEKVPATYKLRSLEERKLATREFGGTEESERAVEDALKWFAATQNAEGYWDASQFGAGTAPKGERETAGRDADTGVTALATLAFLGAGHTPDKGEYAGTVKRALEWIISQQIDSGYLGGKAGFVAGMYCHGMASFALAEAYAMRTEATDGQWLKQPLVKAIDFIVKNQTQDGSWRYVFRKNTYGDMSMFGWQLMALKSAEMGGVPVPTDTKEKMIQFLKDMSRGRDGGLAAYRSTDAVSASMTAEALFCKQMLGLQRSHASSNEAIRYLMQNLPQRTSMNYYFWYYGTLATFQYGGEAWRRWNEQLRDLLVSEQVTEGPFAGSWEPRGEWGPYGGRVYTTATATLCLEVYYRYLPLYQSGGRYDAATPRP
ncbi:MAG: hypothetical protein KDA86_10010 [Planctomycetaceae bacterium]|nr:hypothetical protein [Planctomycetaceae bacterium]MCA9108898.1 hypothetical protein [Planctomycetaceae bacterium]